MWQRTFLAILALACAALMLSCSNDKNPVSPPTPVETITWQKSLGDDDAEWATAVATTQDGGYVAVGGLIVAGSNNQDIYMVRVDSTGAVLWEKSYGGALADYGRTVAATPDGGFVIAGSTYSFGVQETDVYVIKTDSDGTLQWEKTFGGEKWETVYDVICTNDGGYALAGWTSSFNAAGSSMAWLVKIGSDGNLEWHRRYGGGNEDEFKAVQQVHDGSFIMLGNSSSRGVGYQDLYMVKSTDSGDLVWQKSFGGSGNDFGSDLVATPTGYVASGWCGSPEVSNHHGAYDIYILKTDLNGGLLWEFCYGGAGYDGCSKMTATPDGGFAVAGHLQDISTGRTSGYLLKIGSTGNLIWEKTMGNSSAATTALTATADGGMMVAGTYYREGTGNMDIYMAKTDANGATGELNQ